MCDLCVVFARCGVICNFGVEVSGWLVLSYFGFRLLN